MDMTDCEATKLKILLFKGDELDITTKRVIPLENVILTPWGN